MKANSGQPLCVLVVDENKLAAAEARKAVQHEANKTNFGSGVNTEIAARADDTVETTAKSFRKVANEFRGQAVDEAVETEREVGRARGLARVAQVVDYITDICNSMGSKAVKGG